MEKSSCLELQLLAFAANNGADAQRSASADARLAENRGAVAGAITNQRHGFDAKVVAVSSPTCPSAPAGRVIKRFHVQQCRVQMSTAAGFALAE